MISHFIQTVIRYIVDLDSVRTSGSHIDIAQTDTVPYDCPRLFHRANGAFSDRGPLANNQVSVYDDFDHLVLGSALVIQYPTSVPFEHRALGIDVRKSPIGNNDGEAHYGS